MPRPVKQVCLSQFVWSGALIGGLFALGLGALAGLGHLAGIEGAPLLLLPLVGPVPRLLTAFDLSEWQLRVLSVMAIVPYWLTLGGLAGWAGWSRRSTGSEPDQEDLRRCMRRLPLVLGLLALLGAAILFSSFNFVTGGRAPRNAILNNLRQLDGAKHQLALERSLAEGTVITESDLAPYLGPSSPFRRNRLWAERYVINPIGTEPFAIVEKDHRVRRRGWTEGYTVPGGTVIRLNQ